MVQLDSIKLENPRGDDDEVATPNLVVGRRHSFSGLWDEKACEPRGESPIGSSSSHLKITTVDSKAFILSDSKSPMEPVRNDILLRKAGITLAPLEDIIDSQGALDSKTAKQLISGVMKLGDYAVEVRETAVRHNQAYEQVKRELDVAKQERVELLKELDRTKAALHVAQTIGPDATVNTNVRQVEDAEGSNGPDSLTDDVVRAGDLKFVMDRLQALEDNQKSRTPSGEYGQEAVFMQMTTSDGKRVYVQTTTTPVIKSHHGSTTGYELPKVKLQTFDGTSGALTDFNKWLEYFETEALFNGWSEEDKYKMFIRNIAGEPKIHLFCRLKDMIRNDPTFQRNFDNSIAVLRVMYGQPNGMVQASEAIGYRQEINQSARDYFVKKSEMLRQSLKDCGDEAKAIQIIQRLRIDLRNDLLGPSPLELSYDRLLGTVINAESRLQLVKAENSGGKRNAGQRNNNQFSSPDTPTPNKKVNNFFQRNKNQNQAGASGQNSNVTPSNYNSNRYASGTSISAGQQKPNSSFGKPFQPSSSKGAPGVAKTSLHTIGAEDGGQPQVEVKPEVADVDQSELNC